MEEEEEEEEEEEDDEEELSWPIAVSPSTSTVPDTGRTYIFKTPLQRAPSLTIFKSYVVFVSRTTRQCSYSPDHALPLGHPGGVIATSCSASSSSSSSSSEGWLDVPLEASFKAASNAEVDAPLPRSDFPCSLWYLEWSKGVESGSQTHRERKEMGKYNMPKCQSVWLVDA